ncbi:hypothetical protein [Streptomyces griseorubiginosus]|uniref:hypothetical protein n=1 Tax=Streptomyces griseorubiginosus TaxID=67304 RepID=UPI00131CECCD|nr:hypothetical protein [Streptomyces griseorubiginosus]
MPESRAVFMTQGSSRSEFRPVAPDRRAVRLRGRCADAGALLVPRVHGKPHS